MYKSVFLILVVFINSSFVLANDDVELLVQKANKSKLFDNPYWHALLHYKSDSAGSIGSWKSEIVSPDFFLSKQGSINPKDELTATIRSFFFPITENPNLHAQCTFVARFKWLEKKLSWNTAVLPIVHCSRFEEYSSSGNISSISMIFATGFLGNPASYYGHVLLKFNNKRNKGAGLLDNAINFGAKVPDNENPLVYVVKGLFGGYVASFSHEKFYRNNHIYVENELRDMWEYQLDLTQEEVDRIVAHSWEVLGKRYLYYFAKENCAYRMGELLELVIDQPMYSREVPWVLPADVFERLNRIKREGVPLIKNIKRIPSRQGLFYTKYKTLNENIKAIAGEQAHRHDFRSDKYLSLSEKDKSALIDTLFDYYEYRMVVDNDNENLKFLKLELLRERFNIQQIGGVENVIDESVQPPHKGPLASMIQYSVLSNNVFGDGVGIRFRPAYFDMLSLDEGRIPNSTLTMMDIQAVYLNDKLFIKRFDMMNVESLNISQTSLRDDSDWAWKMRFGIENVHLGCLDCNVFNAVGGIGKAIGLFSSKMSIYGMMEMNIQSEYADFGAVGVAVYFGLVGYPMDAWKSRLIIGYKQYVDGNVPDVDIIKWENRFGQNRHWDVRASYELNIESEISIGAGFYW